MSSKLAASIKAGLVLKGVSQNHLADSVGVSGNTVTSWVKDKHFPDKESLTELIQFFGWSKGKVESLLEDWFENEHGEKNYRVTGHDFVTSHYDGDYETFLTELLALDASTIPGMSEQHAGTPKQWAPIFFESPHTWRLLVSGDEIVGYWHFICLKDNFYQQVLDGILVDSEIQIDMLDFPVIEGCYKGYFIVITTRLQDRNPATLTLLKSSIEKSFSQYARNGVFFSKFCATALSFEGKRMCELMGMKFQQRHPRANTGELADIFQVMGNEISTSYWGRNNVIRKTYIKKFDQI
jgi:transcriptional regulator with XRE-family HTH domain